MIRPATIDDIQPIYAMMAAYFKEAVEKCGYALRWDEGPAAAFIGSTLSAANSLSFITEGGEGMILGLMGETWFGANSIAKPGALYVKPEHRNGLIARALLRRFESEAKHRGAKYVLWEFESGVTDSVVLAGMMGKLGYKEQGPVFSKFFKEGETCLL